MSNFLIKVAERATKGRNQFDEMRRAEILKAKPLGELRKDK